MRSAIALLLLFAVPASLLAAVAPGKERKVLAFYYTWYGTPERQGRWVHWDEGSHRPDRLDGRGFPDTGTTDHPQQLYDSNDPAVLRKHLALAAGAGIDVLISTWWRQGDYHDKAGKALLKEAEKSPVKISLYYERTPVSGTDPHAVDKTVEDFVYILNTYASSPAFFRYHGKPVVFIYSRALGQLSRDQWTQVVSRIRKTRSVMLVADSRSPDWLGVFDAIHEYNTVGQVIAKEDYLKQAERLVALSRSRNRVASVTVIPGYDDSNIGRKTPITAPRRGGRLYREMWAAAIKSKPDWVLICSFNEWHEGSEIEPSREYGDRYLRLTSQYAANFKRGSNSVFVSPDVERGFKVSSDSGLIVSASGDPSRAVRVTNLDAHPGKVTCAASGLRTAIVFETGKSDKAFRAVETTSGVAAVSWQARPFTSYTVWTRNALAHYIETRKASMQDAGADPELLLQIQESTAASIGVHAAAKLEFPGPLPEEYRLCVGQPFLATCVVSNTGSSPVTAGLDRLSVPDDWTAVALPQQSSRTLQPNSTASWKFAVTAPVRAVYDLPHPITAWWSVKAKGVSFKLCRVLGADVARPFEREVQVTATSPTEADLSLRLSSNFPGHPLKDVRVTMDIPDEWSSTPSETTLTLDTEKELVFHLTKPADDPPGLRVVTPIFALGDYRGSRRTVTDLYLDLGSDPRAPGLWLVDCEDGKTEATTVGGRTCRRAADFKPGHPCYLYFGVSPNLPVTGKIYVSVHYFDEGLDKFELQYDSNDPVGGLAAAYRPTSAVQRTDTRTWKIHNFVLSGTRFAGSQNGQADFRIASFGTGINVDWVRVSKFPL